MARQPFKFQFLRALSLSTGLALLLANGSAIASPRTGYVVSQANSSGRVVVDTEEDAATPTRRTPTDSSSSPIYDRDTRFSCRSVGGEYTVVYQPESQQGQYFPWAKPSEMGGGWTSQNRCNEIARRLESYRPDGLQELTTGVENGYNTVCVITEQVPDCRIVFTVPSGQDPLTTRDRVFENLTVADSGQQTDAVYTYRGGQSEIDDLINRGREVFGGRDRAKSKSINLKPFLDKNDGGTGKQLQGGVKLKPSNSNNRLNPGSFR